MGVNLLFGFENGVQKAVRSIWEAQFLRYTSSKSAKGPITLLLSRPQGRAGWPRPPWRGLHYPVGPRRAGTAAKGRSGLAKSGRGGTLDFGTSAPKPELK